MDVLLTYVVPALISGGVAVTALAVYRARMRRLLRPVAERFGLTLDVTLGRAKVHGRLGNLDTSLSVAGGGKQGPRMWRISLSRLSLAERCTFLITGEGLVSRALKGVGLKDVEVGDEGFDAIFKLTSSEPDVLRGLASLGDVQDALLELRARGLHSCQLRRDGTLEVALRVEQEESGEAITALVVATALGELLHQHASVAPIAAPLAVRRGALGGGSGAPAAVPTSFERG